MKTYVSPYILLLLSTKTTWNSLSCFQLSIFLRNEEIYFICPYLSYEVFEDTK